MGRAWYVYDDQSRLTAAELLLQGDHQTGPVSHTLLLGADGLVHDAMLASAGGEGTPLDVYTPDYGTFPEPSLNGTAPVENEIQRAALLAQDHMRLADLSVRVGVRRDRVRNTIVGGEAATDWATSGNVGVVYEVLPGLAPYASYSESFQPVSGTDEEGNAFKPKRGEQVEGGVKWEAQFLPIQASAAFYSIREENRLASDPDNVGQSIQIGEARTRGVELDAKGRVSDWNLLGSYTYTRARASADGFGGDLDPDQQIEGIPEHAASAWAVHEFGRLGLPGLSLGAGLRYVGRIGDGTGNVFVPAVTLIDAMAALDRGSWRLALNLNNLTDTSYIASCLARGDCWFGARRGLLGTLTYRW
ncbi:MAG: TonB-dependent receptor [Gemmatimonas sp.]|nr:TonB-dependent receptor [Gemmatimonas sp.]